MAIIEGVGDEVLQFFIVLLLLFLAVLAWWSTKISERPFIRTVLILERRGARETEGEAPHSPTAPPLPPDNKAAEDGALESSNDRDAVTVTTEELNVAAIDGTNSDPQPEDVSGLRNRRLAFFEQGSSKPDVVESSHVRQRSQLREEALAGLSNASEETTPTEAVQTSNIEKRSQLEDIRLTNTLPELSDCISSENMVQNELLREEEPVVDRQEEARSSDQSIRIRLKYLNDELKLVDGNLEEQLGEFKKRHFNVELAGRKLVRLIFNGKVLGQDTWTLRHYGLYDNCVVHCLVHQSRTPPPSPNLSARPGTQRAATLSPWALSNVLLASLSLLLGLAWYGRYQYAQLYTATTTVALVGLTGFFTVSLIGLYMPDLQ